MRDWVITVLIAGLVAWGVMTGIIGPICDPTPSNPPGTHYPLC